MSLLQDVLRTKTLDSLDKALAKSQIDADSEDELVGVFSSPGTPAISRPGSRPSSRATSPSRRGFRGPSNLGMTSGARSRDPLRVLPTEVSQRVFGLLSIRDLARCARVSKKWQRSQTINYVWFQHYRKENFHDESLPPGKWSKRESKQNWRITYLKGNSTRERDPIIYSRPLSPSSNLNSGNQTPRDIREEKWRAESDGTITPSKLEMRQMYKELGGRKARTKNKLGSVEGSRDRGGWSEDVGGHEW